MWKHKFASRRGGDFQHSIEQCLHTHPFLAHQACSKSIWRIRWLWGGGGFPGSPHSAPPRFLPATPSRDAGLLLGQYLDSDQTPFYCSLAVLLGFDLSASSTAEHRFVFPVPSLLRHTCPICSKLAPARTNCSFREFLLLALDKARDPKQRADPHCCCFCARWDCHCEGLHEQSLLDGSSLSSGWQTFSLFSSHLCFSFSSFTLHRYGTRE